MEKELFIVMGSSGEWYDYTRYHFFVTTDEELAQKWVDKYNRILAKWREFYRELNDSVYDEHWGWNRYYDVMNRHSAFIEKIELR